MDEWMKLEVHSQISLTYFFVSFFCNYKKRLCHLTNILNCVNYVFQIIPLIERNLYFKKINKV